MPTEINFVQVRAKLRQPQPRKSRPNRIFELTKRNKWTYPEVAARVRALAVAKGDEARAKVHTVTINRLATGEANLTQAWMNVLGEVFGVAPTELIAAPAADNLRRVQVLYAFEGGKWRKTSMLPVAEQRDIMIPLDHRLHDLTLYAGEITGADNNSRYTPGAIVVVSELKPGAINRPGEITEGRRYHVRVRREADGLIEDAIKCLTHGPDGQLWLKPESNHPAHQEWVPVSGRPGLNLEIVGRVRGVFMPED